MKKALVMLSISAALMAGVAGCTAYSYSSQYGYYWFPTGYSHFYETAPAPYWVEGHQEPDGNWVDGHWEQWTPSYYDEQGNKVPGNQAR